MLKEDRTRPFNQKVVVVTGELSGETHAFHLIKALTRILPLRFSGVGSKKLEAAGVEVIHDYREISLMGLSELISKAGHIWRAYRDLKKHLLESQPSLIILVDFPGFNLRVARMAKKLGIPTIYFIPPQIWAWRRNRIRQIKRNVDMVLCILPFEEELYRAEGIDVAYIGHPFTGTVKPVNTREAFYGLLGIGEERRPLITVMPGSRENEVVRHMPLLLSIIGYLERHYKNLLVLLPLAENIDEAIVERFLRGKENIRPVKGLTYDALSFSDVAVIASGSATLEAAILGVPAVVVYKLSPISFLAARLLVHVRHISLPNIIAGKEIFPEFIQQTDPESIAERVKYVLNNDTGEVRKELEEVRRKLGGLDSYRIASERIIRFLESVYGPLSETP